MNATKSFEISKQLVMDAYKAVKANAGSAGIDEQSIKDFEKDLKDNLYKIVTPLTFIIQIMYGGNNDKRKYFRLL